jgi:Ribonuclease HI
LQINVYSDSSYVVKAITEGWLDKWRLKGLSKQKNPDLWLKYIEVSNGLNINFFWIKGHAGHPENERCDLLAVEAASKNDLLVDAGYIER